MTPTKSQILIKYVHVLLVLTSIRAFDFWKKKSNSFQYSLQIANDKF